MSPLRVAGLSSRNFRSDLVTALTGYLSRPRNSRKLRGLVGVNPFELLAMLLKVKASRTLRRSRHQILGGAFSGLLQPELQLLEQRMVLSTLTVTNTLDDGSTGSLRWAVTQANTSAGDDTINFDSTVFATAQTITLTGTQLELSDTTGATTITGPAAGVTVDANHTSRVFLIDSGVTATLSGLTITGGNGNGVHGDGGGVFNRGTATLTNCTISNNVASANGGGVFSVGPLALSQCIISNNSALGVNASALFDASGFGGGVLALQTQSTFDLCTIAGNSAPRAAGGGIANFYGSSSFTDCAITSNTADLAGVYSTGNLGMTNCTISSNTATLGAGGIVVGGTGLLTNCTISGNSAPVAGGLYVEGDIKLTNTIVAGNTATTSNPDVLGTVGSQGNNLIGQTDGSTGWVSSDLTGTTASPLDAKLAPLGYYGGPTKTMPLLPGSPALAAGTSTGAPSTDQRGLARVGSIDIGAFQTGNWVVNSTADGLVTPSGILDLRQAINLANTVPTADTITFDPTVFATPQTITLAGTELELSDTTGATTITGPAAGVTVDANNASRVFMIDTGVTAALSGLTITGGNSNDGGGVYIYEGAGIYNAGTVSMDTCTISNNATQSYAEGGGIHNTGTLTVNNSTISGNSSQGDGGGISNEGTLTVSNSTLSGNTASQGGALYDNGTSTISNSTIFGNSAVNNGGGLQNEQQTMTIDNCLISGNSAGRFGGAGVYNYEGTVTITNSTISQNTTTSTGGGIYNQDTLLLINSTITDNSATDGGGIFNWSGSTVSLTNTIVAGNTATTAGPDVNGPYTSQGYNLIGQTDGSTGWVGSDLTGTTASPLDAKLAPLGNYGGPTQTMPLLPGSPAIAAGTSTGAPTTDQRGLIRGSIVDIGATQASLAVMSNSGAVDTTAGGLTLPGAVSLANQFGGANSITFDSTVFATAQTITLGGTQLELSDTTGATTITGPAAGVTVDANHASRVFMIDSGVTAALSGLTITGGNGNGVGGDGGGVFNRGTATLTNCTISNNVASANGGGVFSVGPLALSQCIISNNSALGVNASALFDASGFGGGVLALQTQSTFDLCTIAGNSAPRAAGGGIANFYGSSSFTDCAITSNTADLAGVYSTGNLGMTNCTISSNTATLGAGGIVVGGTGLLTNCTISGNSAPVAGGLAADGDIKLTNTIVAGNTATDASPDVYGTVNSQGYNLIGQTDGSTGWVGTDLTGTTASPLDAMLAPLGNYGGPTQTMPLLPGSPAIAAGTSTGAPTTDQRGLVRGSVVDIGATQASIVVMSTAGAVDTTAAGLTLAGAVSLANQFGGANFVTFDPTVFAAMQTITLTGTQLELSDTTGATTITGPAAGVTVDANNASRVLAIDANVAASVSGLTITGGNARDAAGVLNRGTLNLTNCTVSRNSASHYGGGIFNYSMLTLTNCTVSDNSATENGGGVYNKIGTITLTDCTVSGNTSDYGGGVLNSPGATAILLNSTLSGNSAVYGGGLENWRGTATLTNCTVSGNSASSYGGGVMSFMDRITLTNCTVSGNSAKYGGGVYESSGTLTITNSTISQNSASKNGGGVYAFGTRASVTITNSTISQNSATIGGGLSNFKPGPVLTLTDTIVAGNTAGIGPDAYASVTSQGYNLIGQTDGSTGWVGSDLTGTTASPLNPLLAPLGNYGGPTQTMALLPGSPAINAGTSTGAPSTDQRGSSRVGGVDIGAFESQGFTLTPVANSTPQSTNWGAAFSHPLGVTVTANNPAEPVNGGVVTFSAPGSGASATLSAGLATISSGVASVTATANNSVGGYSVSATANGAAAPLSFALTNTVRPTSTGLVSSNTTSVYGTSVTFTATVTSGATGTVTFKDGATVLGIANINGGTATFSTAALKAGSHTIMAVYGGDSLYATSTSSAVSQTVNQAVLTVTVNPISKVYDGTIVAYVTYNDNRVSGDVLTINSTSASYGSKYAGTGKAVNINGLSLSGADAGNYTLSATKITTTGTVTKAVLTVSATGVNRVYDGTTAATVTLAGQLPGDVVTFAYGTATFSDKNAGTGKPVTVTGIRFTGGNDSGNYTLAGSTATTTANITPKALTGTVTALNKVYDGTTAATLASRSISGLLSGDTVTVFGGTATFSDKNAGTGKTVTATGLGLSGASSANYSIGAVTTTASINPKAIVGSITVAGKVFDSNTSGTITSRTLSGVLGSDVVSLASQAGSEKALFSDKNVGTAKVVTAYSLYLTGGDAANYTVNSSATTTANISPFALIVTASGTRQVYNGGTATTVLLACNSPQGSTVTLSYASASFADKNVGSNKTVTVTGIQLSGADALNYTFNSTATTTGNITPRSLVLTATVANKQYDGTTKATVTSLLDNRVTGDSITLSYAAAAFASAAIGNNIAVTVGVITASGADTGNYSIPSYAYTTANITG